MRRGSGGGPGAAGIFPNPESCLRLVTVHLMEHSEDCPIARSYLGEGSLKSLTIRRHDMGSGVQRCELELTAPFFTPPASRWYNFPKGQENPVYLPQMMDGQIPAAAGGSINERILAWKDRGNAGSVERPVDFLCFYTKNILKNYIAVCGCS